MNKKKKVTGPYLFLCVQLMISRTKQMDPSISPAGRETVATSAAGGGCCCSDCCCCCWMMSPKSETFATGERQRRRRRLADGGGGGSTGDAFGRLLFLLLSVRPNVAVATSNRARLARNGRERADGCGTRHRYDGGRGGDGTRDDNRCRHHGNRQSVLRLAGQLHRRIRLGVAVHRVLS